MGIRAAFGLMYKNIRRHSVRLGTENLLQALEPAGRPSSGGVFIHSGLSSYGYIEGGAATVVDALKRWNKNGMTVLPTHTYCYPNAGNEAPVFDARRTPSKVGKISEYFRNLPNVVRSIHPTHSLAADGENSRALCEGHQLCNNPCGAGTPYEKLIKMEASVLMFGATMDAYTLFHTAEDEAKVPYLYETEPYQLKFLDEKGQVKTLLTWRQDMSILRRFADMGLWLQERGLLKTQKLGLGALLFIPNALAVHRAIVDQLKKEPLFLVKEEMHSSLKKRFGI